MADSDEETETRGPRETRDTLYLCNKQLHSIYTILVQILNFERNIDVTDTNFPEAWGILGFDLDVHKRHIVGFDGEPLDRSRITEIPFITTMAGFLWTGADSMFIGFSNRKIEQKRFLRKNGFVLETRRNELDIDCDLDNERPLDVPMAYYYNTKFLRLYTSNEHISSWFCANFPEIVDKVSETELCDHVNQIEQMQATKAAEMTDIVANVRKRARELEEEEEQKKRARRASDTKIQKCSHMNEVCVYQPLDMEDWCEHNENYYYGPDTRKRCFDAEELLRHFESLLMATYNTNPYPQYPNDPFSRELFDLNQLEEFLSFCEDAGIEVATVSPTFKAFMEWSRTLPDRYVIDAKPFSPNIRNRIVEEVVHPSRRFEGGSTLQSIIKFFGLHGVSR